MMLGKAKRASDRLIDTICLLLLAVATVVCFYQVVARYVFSSPPSWSEEVARYCFVWLAFLGSSIAFREGAHLGLDILTASLPPKVKRAVLLAGSCMIALVLVFLIWEGREVSQFASRQLTPALQVSMAIPYSAIPVGAFFMLVEVLWKVYTTAGGKEVR